MAARVCTRSAHAVRSQLRSTTPINAPCLRQSSPKSALFSSCNSLRATRHIPVAAPRHLAAYFSTTARMGGTRTETDAFGPLEVDSSRYWGAQTQRSLGNFKINQPQDRMPEGVVRAFGILKGAAAKVNMRYGLGGVGPYRNNSCS